MAKKVNYFIIVLLLLLLLFTAIIAGGEEVRWETSSNHTLHQGEMISKGGFVVSAFDFDTRSDTVSITIFKGNTTVSQDVLGAGGMSTYNDDIKIIVRELWGGDRKDQWVKIEVFLRKRPGLAISISTDKNEYKPQNTVSATVTVRNNGNDKIQRVELNIDSGLESVYQNSRYYFGEIQNGKSEKIIMEYRVPLLSESKYITVTANASGIDWKNVTYTASASKKITVLPVQYLEIKKMFTDSLFLHETASAYIKIRNTGIVDLKSIQVTDEIPAGFELKNGTGLKWNLSLKPGEETSYFYLLKPVYSGNLSVPAAAAEFTVNGTNYIVESNRPHVLVRGPRPVITKTTKSSVVAPGDEINVAISVKNEGDLPAIISITETLPQGVSLVKGKLSLNQVLNRSEIQTFDYTVTVNNFGKTDFPPATAEFTYSGADRNFTALSNIFSVLAVNSSGNSPEVTSPGTPIPAASTPGFESLIAAIAFMLLCFIKRRSRTSQ